MGRSTQKKSRNSVTYIPDRAKSVTFGNRIALKKRQTTIRPLTLELTVARSPASTPFSSRRGSPDAASGNGVTQNGNLVKHASVVSAPECNLNAGNQPQVTVLQEARQEFPLADAETQVEECSAKAHDAEHNPIGHQSKRTDEVLHTDGAVQQSVSCMPSVTDSQTNRSTIILHKMAQQSRKVATTNESRTPMSSKMQHYLKDNIGKESESVLPSTADHFRTVEAHTESEAMIQSTHSSKDKTNTGSMALMNSTLQPYRKNAPSVGEIECEAVQQRLPALDTIASDNVEFENGTSNLCELPDGNQFLPVATFSQQGNPTVTGIATASSSVENFNSAVTGNAHGLNTLSKTGSSMTHPVSGDRLTAVNKARPVSTVETPGATLRDVQQQSVPLDSSVAGSSSAQSFELLHGPMVQGFQHRSNPNFDKELPHTKQRLEPVNTQTPTLEDLLVRVKYDRQSSERGRGFRPTASSLSEMCVVTSTLDEIVDRFIQTDLSTSNVEIKRSLRSVADDTSADLRKVSQASHGISRINKQFLKSQTKLRQKRKQLLMLQREQIRLQIELADAKKEATAKSKTVNETTIKNFLSLLGHVTLQPILDTAE